MRPVGVWPPDTSSGRPLEQLAASATLEVQRQRRKRRKRRKIMRPPVSANLQRLQASHLINSAQHKRTSGRRRPIGLRSGQSESALAGHWRAFVRRKCRRILMSGRLWGALSSGQRGRARQARGARGARGAACLLARSLVRLQTGRQVQVQSRPDEPGDWLGFAAGPKVALMVGGQGVA